jgi:hypothetical protein
VAAGVAAGALVAAVALVLLAVVAAIFLPLGDGAVATFHRTFLLLGHGDSSGSMCGSWREPTHNRPK